MPGPPATQGSTSTSPPTSGSWLNLVEVWVLHHRTPGHPPRQLSIRPRSHDQDPRSSTVGTTAAIPFIFGPSPPIKSWRESNVKNFANALLEEGYMPPDERLHLLEPFARDTLRLFQPSVAR